MYSTQDVWQWMSTADEYLRLNFIEPRRSYYLDLPADVKVFVKMIRDVLNLRIGFDFDVGSMAWAHPDVVVTSHVYQIMALRDVDAGVIKSLRDEAEELEIFPAERTILVDFIVDSVQLPDGHRFAQRLSEFRAARARRTQSV
jgi:hypothetical protein